MDFIKAVRAALIMRSAEKLKAKIHSRRVPLYMERVDGGLREEPETMLSARPQDGTLLLGLSIRR